MPDLTPNDLSHLSDAEFHSLCPQGEHAPGPEPLSAAAKAVRNAVWAAAPAPSEELAAVALRVLATHQRAPIRLGEPIDWWDPPNRVRTDLLALAHELEQWSDG